MDSVRSWNTTIGKKLIMGFSGLLLIGYLILHLAGNLMIFIPDGGDTFNAYSHTLHKLGPLLLVARIILAALFVGHIISAIRVVIHNRRARSNRYAVSVSKGGPSKMSIASRWMAFTGVILLIFVPLHIFMFTLGPHYETVVDGEVMRDLYRLVIERFKEPRVVVFYAAVMLFLSLHLAHGFWSGLQSLGTLNKRLLPIAYTIGVVLAVLLAGGFFVLPPYAYFFIPLP